MLLAFSLIKKSKSPLESARNKPILEAELGVPETGEV